MAFSFVKSVAAALLLLGFFAHVKADGTFFCLEDSSCVTGKQLCQEGTLDCSARVCSGDPDKPKCQSVSACSTDSTGWCLQPGMQCRLRSYKYLVPWSGPSSCIKGSSCRLICDETDDGTCIGRCSPSTVTTSAPTTNSATISSTEQESISVSDNTGLMGADSSSCGSGQLPVSVEGAGIYCTPIPICTGTTPSTGNCPGPRTTLPQGSYCDIIKATGAYGCIAGAAPTTTAPSFVAVNDKGQCSQEGYVPISVEGVSGTFCAKQQICVEGFPTGSCPGPQPGLPAGSVCGKVVTGATGCIVPK